MRASIAACLLFLIDKQNTTSTQAQMKYIFKAYVNVPEDVDGLFGLV